MVVDEKTVTMPITQPQQPLPVDDQHRAVGVAQGAEAGTAEEFAGVGVARAHHDELDLGGVADQIVEHAAVHGHRPDVEVGVVALPFQPAVDLCANQAVTLGGLVRGRRCWSCGTAMRPGPWRGT